jgi:putative endopeptidase
LQAQQIADLYSSFMDEAAIEKAGLKPLAPVFAKIKAVKDKKQLPELFAYLEEIGVTTPFGLAIYQDKRDSSRYAANFEQSGLGLPDRDYYLKDDDAKLKEARAKYQAHIAKMLGMMDGKHAAGLAGKQAAEIVALETELAKAQWTKVQNRNPVKTYNKLTLDELAKLTPDYDWKPYLDKSGLASKIDYAIVRQPTYLSGFDQALKNTPLSAWKSYLAWHVLSEHAPYLGKAYVDENFAFYGTVIRGVPENQPRWKRAVNFEQSAIGEGLGKLYVEKYFPPEYKVRMEQMVANLLAAYRQSIDTLDWMGPETKKEAQAKLAALTPKIAYPSKWRDYSAMKVVKGDLIGNAMRASEFEYWRNLRKLGQPVDRAEWGMTPQTINAYYNPRMNEIVFPAAILQPPFFNPQADDAVNYGAIGAVIGHEISHGFDDQGSQYDGNGNLRDWWTKEDHEKFAAKTAALVKQYDSYSPLPGYHVNGQLTLGENIGDNSGLAIAFKAYKLSLGGKAAPVIDGLSGEQRLYVGFAQIWREKVRENQEIVYIKTNPHSPPEFRANGTLKNQPGFYEAFGVKEGDAMYLAPDQRVIMW